MTATTPSERSVKPARTRLKPTDFPTLRSVGALILREMGATYGRNPGGYIWAIVEPVGSVALLAFGFSFLLSTPPLGSDFLIFFATGFLPFSFYLSISNKVQQALLYSKPLLTYPRVVWIDAVMARLVLAILTDVTVMTIVITGILLMSRDQVVIEFAPIFTGLAILAIGATGVGLINGLMAGVFPIWPTLWAILNRPLFLASGVIFILDSMPAAAREILLWNPILQAIAELRTGFYPGYAPDYVSLPYCFALGLILLAVGLLVMGKWHKIALER